MTALHRRTSRLLLLAAGVLLMGAGAASALAAPLSAAQLQSDLQLARGALEEAHGGVYRYTPKADLDRVFDAAARKLDRPMEAIAFARILAPAVAALRCGHTAVLLSPALKAEMEQALLLPLDVKLLRGRLYILRDFDGAGKLAGREIVSINGVAIGSVIERLLAAAPGDGLITTGRAQRVARKFKEELFIQFGMQGKFTLGLRAPKRESVTLAGQTLAALRQASVNRYPQDQHSHKFTELSLLDGGKIARLQVFNFTDEEEDDEGGAMLKKAFEKIEASGAQTLLLDLRDNGGGEDRLGKLVFSYLVEAPFPYYEALTVQRERLSFAAHVEGSAVIPAAMLTARPDGLFAVKGHPNLGMQKPSLPTFRGKVIALINGRSFSTTAELITQLHDKQRATFVGEESGGAYHGNNSGNDVTLVLPNSDLRIAIPLVTYKLAVSGQHANGRGVVPEVEVLPSMQDYLAGRDVVLEKALGIARAQ
ncbi:S41 family peptidase [Massilia sp. TWP1-3-3]|uniref:S41 family peptidase n=1 Tax=Massilia sp. TWP1-3-3 TaxID=2804573 RepID=UPI003CF56B4E